MRVNNIDIEPAATPPCETEVFYSDGQFRIFVCPDSARATYFIVNGEEVHPYVFDLYATTNEQVATVITNVVRTHVLARLAQYGPPDAPE